MSTTAPGQAPYEIEDRPAPRGSRGWKGMERSRDELMAFAGAVGIILVAVLAFLAAGVPGLLTAFLLVTLAVFAAIIVISMGN